MPDQNKATIIKQSKLGIELTEQQCTILSELMDISEHADGDIVLPEGATDDHLRIVLSGALAVAKKSTDANWVRLNVLTAGDFAGELAFLDSLPRYAALVALGPTRLLSLQRVKLESLLNEHPMIVYRVMRAIARFAHQVLHRSGTQITELNAYLFKTGPKY